MFYDAKVFNQKIGNWDVSKVTNMGYMFAYASAFDGNISSWDTTSVNTMDHMFYNAVVFEQDISQWTGSGASNTASEIFYGATAFQAKFCVQA